GDVPDGAGGGAANDDGLAAFLGREEQVASPDARLDPLWAGQPQDAVRPRMLVPLGVAVGEERRIAAAESGWHEARALDTDVAAIRQPRCRQGGHRAIGPDGEDPPSCLAGGDEIPAITAE